MEGNRVCEEKFTDMIVKSRSEQHIQADVQHCITYNTVCSDLTLSLLKANASKVKSSGLKSFIRARTTRVIKRGRVSYSNVPANKDDLMK